MGVFVGTGKALGSEMALIRSMVTLNYSWKM